MDVIYCVKVYFRVGALVATHLRVLASEARPFSLDTTMIKEKKVKFFMTDNMQNIDFLSCILLFVVFARKEKMMPVCVRSFLHPLFANFAGHFMPPASVSL